MKRALWLWVALGLLVGCGPTTPEVVETAEATPEAYPLLSREVLFGNPDRSSPQISPTGEYFSWLAPVDGVMNVWVAPVSDGSKAAAITKDKKRGIRGYFWAPNGRFVLYVQDKGGDENWRVYSVNVATGEEKDLTPFDGVAARILKVAPEHPSEIVIGLNNRVPELHDVYRVDIDTGEMELLQKNDGFLGYDIDDDFNVRLAWKAQPDGSMQVLKTDGEKWEEFMTIPAEDVLTTDSLGFDHTGDWIYLKDSRKYNTAVLRKTNVKTGETKLLAKNDKADLAGVMRHPTKKHIQMVTFEYDREVRQILDKNIKDDIAALEKLSDGDLWVVSRTLDDNLWIVQYVDDDGPVRWFRYDRTTKKGVYLFANRTQLEGAKLAKMHPVVIKSRDGLDLVSYLTLPADTDKDGDARPDQPLPMVLWVHGGPWSRNSWGYHSYHQWLANRGYAVLSVNYRGSTGFGKEFINASTKEWGGKMHDDLIDAVDWAVTNKIALPDKVAIAGGSYGGYATLVGLTFTPDKFACGVDIVGPSNLNTLLSSIPPYWKPMLDMFATRVGDPRTEEGKKLLEERSPLTKVDAISKPLLIGQGANDPRVKQAEADQIVEKMKTKKIPVTYLLFPDEGHGFARPENRLAFNAVMEAFLAEHLGGRVEPYGSAFKGSSVQIPEGVDQVKGLAEAFPKTPIDTPPDSNGGAMK